MIFIRPIPGQAMRDLPQYLAATPRIINVQDVPGDDWHQLAELSVD